MPTVPVETLPRPTGNMALSLTGYAQYVQYDEAAFWGVRKDPAHYGWPRGCREIWNQKERDLLKHYLGVAQGLLEDRLGYPLSPRWIEDEEHVLGLPVSETRQAHIVRAGRKTEEVIEAEAEVAHETDPALVTLAAPLGLTDPEEVWVFHAGTDIQVMPSAVTVEGGTIVIEIPRVRLVLPEYADNPTEGWEYTDLTHFADAVEVRRIYTDTEDHGTYVCTPGCSCSLCNIPTSAEEGCGTSSHPLCLILKDKRLGLVSIEAYSPTRECAACRPISARLNYQAGYPMTPAEKETLIQLTYALIPTTPCGCSILKGQWERARQVPALGEPTTSERYNSGFGQEYGAFRAWIWAERVRVVRAGSVGTRVPRGRHGYRGY